MVCISVVILLSFGFKLFHCKLLINNILMEHFIRKTSVYVLNIGRIRHNNHFTKIKIYAVVLIFFKKYFSTKASVDIMLSFGIFFFVDWNHSEKLNSYFLIKADFFLLIKSSLSIKVCFQNSLYMFGKNVVHVYKYLFLYQQFMIMLFNI